MLLKENINGDTKIHEYVYSRNKRETINKEDAD